ncbi:hypothetical protein [Sphaerisporangium fuscum]|uniref:hypothetical protein n=1 Tax=Sphaerisporangium fuscum TaxID=2835868 RepID=UPI001BDC6DFF|nr:hypothetical protein [Sphaerisporangium fuscum]
MREKVIGCRLPVPKDPGGTWISGARPEQSTVPSRPAAVPLGVGVPSRAPGETGGPDVLDSRLRDEIDDQVAEAFDAYLADRLAEPGPLRSALAARSGAKVVLATVALGALATALAPGGVTVVCWIWGAITVIDLAWLLSPRRR